MLRKRQMIGFLEYITIIFVILSSRVVYSHTLNVDYHIPEITAFLCLILFIAKFFLDGIPVSILRRWLFFAVPYFILVLVYAFVSVTPAVFLSYAARFFAALPCLVLLMCVYRREGRTNVLLSKYVNVMAVHSVVSLFFWVFGSLLHWIKPTGMVRVSWGPIFDYPSYFGIYFERQTQSFLFYHGLRNMGMFVEGPMHSLCLIIAISAELFLLKDVEKKRRNKRFCITLSGKRLRDGKEALDWKLVLLIITLITTVTTTGTILLLFIWVIWFLMNKPQSRITAAIKILSSIFVIVGGLASMYYVFSAKASSTGSWNGRMAGYIAGFYVWMEYPFFGSGYAENERTNSLIDALGGGFANSIAAVMAQGGLVLMSIYLTPLIGGMAVALYRKRKNEAVFALMVLLEFILTTWSATYLMMLLLAYFYSMLLMKEESAI